MVNSFSGGNSQEKSSSEKKPGKLTVIGTQILIIIEAVLALPLFLFLAVVNTVWSNLILALTFGLGVFLFNKAKDWKVNRFLLIGLPIIFMLIFPPMILLGRLLLPVLEAIWPY